MLQIHNTLKRKLAAGETTYGFWVTLESPTLTEIALALDVDWVVIDAEHGHLDYREVIDHLRVLRNSGVTALVRITEIQPGIIKRVLDVGADGIIVPQVTSGAQAAEAVRCAKYPPAGIRGVGGERSTNWGLTLADSTRAANAETMVVPMIESHEGADAIDAILDVDGVDAIFFGPADFSATAGHLGQWEGPGVAERILETKQRIRDRGSSCGLMATSHDDATKRREQGFQMIGLMSDVGAVIRSLGGELKALRGE